MDDNLENSLEEPTTEIKQVEHKPIRKPRSEAQLEATIKMREALMKSKQEKKELEKQIQELKKSQKEPKPPKPPKEPKIKKTVEKPILEEESDNDDEIQKPIEKPKPKPKQTNKSRRPKPKPVIEENEDDDDDYEDPTPPAKVTYNVPKQQQRIYPIIRYV